jgi:hypothetical protein
VPRYRRYPLPLLSAEETSALERDYHTGESRLLRQRAQIVLLAYSLSEQGGIAPVRRSLDTVRPALALDRVGVRWGYGLDGVRSRRERTPSCGKRRPPERCTLTRSAVVLGAGPGEGHRLLEPASDVDRHVRLLRHPESVGDPCHLLDRSELLARLG